MESAWHAQLLIAQHALIPFSDLSCLTVVTGCAVDQYTALTDAGLHNRLYGSAMQANHLTTIYTMCLL